MSFHNYRFRDVNEALPKLLDGVLQHGQEVGSRNGRAKELTFVGICIDQPELRELTIPGRKPNLAAQVAETMWVLAGRNDIAWLGRYLPRAADFSDDGETWRAGYGPRLRKWECLQENEKGQLGKFVVDQLATVVERLRANPLDRRAVISLWDPAVDSQDGKDIACNNWLSFSHRDGYLSMQVGVRSNDLMWGFSGINTFEWSALLEIVARLTGAQVGALHFSTTSLHLYEPHWAKAERIIAEAPRIPWHAAPSPAFAGGTSALNESFRDFETLIARWFEAEELIREQEVGWRQVIEDFPDPMLQSWLRVLAWWWTADQAHLLPLKDTRLWFAAQAAVQPKPRRGRDEQGKFTGQRVDLLADDHVVASYFEPSDFVTETQKLHTSKHAAYGDSWKRRGEMLGIMANIARKIDRLGNGETDDETQADTATDLMVYLAKYAIWIEEHGNGTPHDVDRSDFPDAANRLLAQVERRLETEREDVRVRTVTELETWLRLTFDQLEELVVAGDKPGRRRCVDDMLDHAFVLARLRWDAARDDYQGADAD